MALGEKQMANLDYWWPHPDRAYQHLGVSPAKGSDLFPDDSSRLGNARV